MFGTIIEFTDRELQLVGTVNGGTPRFHIEFLENKKWIFAKAKYSLRLSMVKIMKKFGEDLKLARLRRKLSTEQVSERAGISRYTLWQIEKRIAGCIDGLLCTSAFCFWI
jgi:hypothetical protein